MRVALLGPRGTFSEEAAYVLDRKPEISLCSDIDEIFYEVLKGKVKHGIVPVENSLEGSVVATLDLLLKSDIKIYGEIILDIRHYLMALPSTSLSNIKEVISHPHALAQCKKFLRGLGAKTRGSQSTAEAAREVAEKKLKGSAAVATKVAAKLYGLKILKEDIQDEDQNKTRFLVISKRDHEKTGKDKTSIIFGLRDRPGALYKTLGAFAKKGINLTRIESRPSRKALGDYVFYIDLEGHKRDTNVRDALKELADEVLFLKVLGSYPRS